ncbi:putative lipoprotein [Treponema primitia ZAS-2]|uniref:Putative lipoprotein n=1 Tax=Treponema primitia (strain ATCC BAA-887 / DSM 12427 / ZAS-2) TaxID=545694 RepID=F5YGP9_TREPZ|nr:hypothetical protein [Treponema primitia]AEF83818.1 putative lipoprotein [Treponema primitia ZAS-2]
MKIRRFCIISLSSFFVLLVVASCASSPKGQGPGQSLGQSDTDFASLPTGGLVYFLIDVNKARPIMNHISLGGLNGKQAQSILKKVNYISGAMFPAGAPQRIIAHAWRLKGNLPGGAGLSFSSRWKKTGARGKTYWHSDKDGLSVALKKGDAYVSDKNPFPDTPPIAVPDKLADLRFEAVLLGWLEDAGSQINRFLSTTGLPMQIPTQQVFFAVSESQTADDDDAPSSGPGPLYRIAIRVETQSESQAKALATLLSYVRVFTETPNLNMEEGFLEILKPLLANPPSQEGTDLWLRTGAMNAERVALLFSGFSVYSR